MTDSISTKKYIIRVGDDIYYCKLIKKIIRDNVSYDMFFGSKNTYCLNVAISPFKEFPFIGYVEYDEHCFEKLERDSSIKLVKAALWIIKSLFPNFTKINFEDNSNIYCIRGNKSHKLSLACDYIMKYNKTWYEYHFNATLPGTINNLDSVYSIYRKSLEIIDKPIKPYTDIISTMKNFDKYKDIYELSNTPREFISKLKEKYNDYCMEFKNWLYSYVTSALNIDLFEKQWFIYYKDIKCPDGYSIEETNVTMKGGKRHKTIKKQFKTNGRSVGYFGHPDFA